MTAKRQQISIGSFSFYKGEKRTQSEWEAASKQLIDQGQAMVAFDLATEGLNHFPASLKLKQLTAQAKIKIGALDDARKILEPLCGEVSVDEKKLQSVYLAFRKIISGPEKPSKESLKAINELIQNISQVEGLQAHYESDEESFGLLARVYKDIWKGTGDEGYLRKCRDTYLRGYIETGRYWTGINVATMSWILKEEHLAKKYAEEVRNICEKEVRAPKRNDLYWLLATLGEAQLLLDKPREAEKEYRKAVKHAGQKHGYIVSSLQQLLLLKNNGFPVPQKLFEILKPPAVIIFTGHMIDDPNRPDPRFPAYLESAVRKEIDKALNDLDARIGYCSAACGSDIVFIEAMIERKAEVNVVLPFEMDDFIKTSVRYAGERWETRFKNVLKLADTVNYVTEERFFGDEPLFYFGAQVFQGYGYIRAHLMGATPYLLAVWDKKKLGFTGGTSDIVERWSDPAKLKIIDIKKILKQNPKPARLKKDGFEKGPSQEKDKQRSKKDDSKRVIKSMLFADIVGYSKLQEEHLKFFKDDFLPKISAELSKVKTRPNSINTWGDAIYAVMDTATDMAKYAVTLLDAIQDIDHEEKDLPFPLDIRIGLHAGPVFEEIDPFTNQKNFYGSHVNRTARIEPITAPGCIYASEQFVALLTVEQIEKHGNDLSRSELTCEYVGTLPLSKKFGSQAIYLVRKRHR